MRRRKDPGQVFAWLMTDDVWRGLRGLTEMRKLLEDREEHLVRLARAQGNSWLGIAMVLGVSRQTVHRKWARRLADE